MKRLILVLDGLGDLPNKELGNRTPLEAAKTPYMDFLAEEGKTGMMYPISPSVAPESDEAMIALLGYNVFQVHRGRGPLEAFGAGVKFKQGSDVVLRANFSTEREGYITDIRAGRPSERKAKQLAKKLNKIRGIKFVQTIGYRSVLIISGGLSPKVTNTHPGYKLVNNFVSSAQQVADKKLKVKKCVPLEKKAEMTAHIVNSFTARAKELLANEKKANYVLLRGAGNELPKVKPLKGKWAVITDMPVESGIGKLLGMKILKKKGGKSEKKKHHKTRNLTKSLNVILKNWKKFDNFYIQIKGPDMFGHLGQPIKKKKAIEEIDKYFVKPLLKKINLNDTVLVITADHSTPCSKKAHSSDPVPLLIYGKGKDKILTFSEKDCKKGSLKRILGKHLLKFSKI